MIERKRPKLAPVLVPALLILAGFGLRAALLNAGRFHVDEALYATFARDVAAGGDPLLLGFSNVDKPPLGVYATAAAFAALDVTEFAARVPNLFASVLSLAALWALGQHLYRGDCRGTGRPKVGCCAPTKTDVHPVYFALLLVTFSPYDVLFAPTVFAEPQVTLWVLLACWMVARERWGWAGVCLALGLATKQSILFYVPLVLALGIVNCRSDPPRPSVGGRPHMAARRLLRFALPLLICGALLALWDAQRGPGRSFWMLNYANNAPDRWVRSGEVLPRLVKWGYWLSTFTGSAALNLLLLALGAAGMTWRVIYRARWRETVIDLVLAGYALVYLGLLWLLAFNTYDRYVHALLPFAALLAARGICCALARLRAGTVGIVLVTFVVVVCVAGPLSDALGARVPVGGDKGEHDGIDQVAAFLNTLPPGTQICDHWLGWELGFYLGREPSLRVVWHPRPDVLADWLLRGDTDTPCYLPAPAGAPIGRWLRTVERAGFTTAEVFAAEDRWGERSFVVCVIE